MNKFIDKSFLKNPLFEYIKWFLTKGYYQLKYWGKHLRIGYMAKVNDTQFERYNSVGAHSIVGETVIGDFSYIGDNCKIYTATIGKFCSIGPGVFTSPGKHPTHFVSTHPVTYNLQPDMLKNFVTTNNYINRERVFIGNDVWIGANSIIIDGVKIGNGAIVAANSVVTKNVDNYNIVGGVPAKLIKKRFDDDQIETLSKSEWWNKSDKYLEENISRFLSVTDFVQFINNKGLTENS